MTNTELERLARELRELRSKAKAAEWLSEHRFSIADALDELARLRHDQAACDALPLFVWLDEQRRRSESMAMARKEQERDQ